jgi:adenylosuccinate lyase
MLPEAFLITDELLRVTRRIVTGMQVDQAAIQRNLALYSPFAATERVLMALGKAGADRQSMHERLREHSLKAWAAIQSGAENPLFAALGADDELLRYLSSDQIRSLMDVSTHIGDAPRRARLLARAIRENIA